MNEVADKFMMMAERAFEQRDKLRAAILTAQCPRPANKVPVDTWWTVKDCTGAGDCGCDLGTWIITLTKQPQHLGSPPPPESGDGAPEIEITEEMIEAGAIALGRLGLGGDGPMGELRRAAQEVFEAMMDASRSARKREGT